MKLIDFRNSQYFSPAYFKKSEKNFGKLKHYPIKETNDFDWYKIFEKKLNKQLKKREFFPLLRTCEF